MQLDDFERRAHRFESPVCVHCAFTQDRSGDGRAKVANASKISVHGGTNMTGANPAEARNPFDLVVYLTQAVPNGMLTQGNVILVLVLVLCVCGILTVRLLVVELLARRKVLLRDRLDHHALVTGDRLGSLGL
jgi:hypothetical protein